MRSPLVLCHTNMSISETTYVGIQEDGYIKQGYIFDVFPHEKTRLVEQLHWVSIRTLCLTTPLNWSYDADGHEKQVIDDELYFDILLPPDVKVYRNNKWIYACEIKEGDIIAAENYSQFSTPRAHNSGELWESFVDALVVNVERTTEHPENAYFIQGSLGNVFINHILVKEYEYVNI